MSDQEPIGPPLSSDCSSYMGEHQWADVVVQAAWKAEKAAQRSVCNVPADDEAWPEDLREALRRRVAHNLAMRGLPIAVHATMTDAAVATTRVGGTDPEVRRLEGPFRKRQLA